VGTAQFFLAGGYIHKTSKVLCVAVLDRRMLLFDPAGGEQHLSRPRIEEISPFTISVLVVHHLFTFDDRTKPGSIILFCLLLLLGQMSASTRSFSFSFHIKILAQGFSRRKKKNDALLCSSFPILN
jgi:hypothetical protein